LVVAIVPILSFLAYVAVRAAIIYRLPALMGSVISAILVQHIPVVGSYGALFRLLGAMLAGLTRNWKIYIAKASQLLIVRSLNPIQLSIFGLFFFLQFSALAMMGFVAVINFCIGLLLFADNFSSIGGFLSGILLGFVLLFNPQFSIMERRKVFLIMTWINLLRWSRS